MITVEDNKATREADLIRLWESSVSMIEKLKEIFPGRRIRLEIGSNSEDYWLDGDCYTVERRFYTPAD